MPPTTQAASTGPTPNSTSLIALSKTTPTTAAGTNASKTPTRTRRPSSLLPVTPSSIVTNRCR